jgi:ATP-binding cassette subfamily B protein
MGYLKPYIKELVFGPIFKLAEAILELIIPLIVASIIDIGIKKGDGDYVLRMGGVMVLLASVGFCSALVCQYFAAKASQGFGTNLRSKMFSHINSLSRPDIEQFGVSTLATRVTNDIYKLQVGVAMFIRLAIRAPFLIIGSVVMSMTIDLPMSVIFIITAAGIALALYFIMSRTSPFLYCDPKNAG